MRKRILRILALVLILPLTTLSIVCGEEEPIQIISDRLDAYDDKGMVLFSGNVVATQDNTVIHSDELYIYYDKQNSMGDSLAGTTTDSGKIERIELKGNVTMKRGERTVTGDRAIFYNAEQKIVVTGNSVMSEGDNVIKGDRITVFLEENRGVVDSSGGERVTATIYPDDIKK